MTPVRLVAPDPEDDTCEVCGDDGATPTDGFVLCPTCAGLLAA